MAGRADPAVSGASATAHEVRQFEAIVKRIAPTLKRIAGKLQYCLALADREDLYQEALLHAWVHYVKGELDGKTDSYILQGCYFHLRNYLRKSQDRATLVSLSLVIDDDGSELQEVLSVNDSELADQVEGKLQVEAVEASGMSERERQVLSLSMEGMTTREIGRVLGVSHVSVVKAKDRIRKRYERVNGMGTAADEHEARPPARYAV